MFKISQRPKSYDDRRTRVAAGFHMTFSNGNTISVQFGCGNYCENNDETRDSCADAEIAIWADDGTWYTFESDEVKGYCTPDEVADWILFAKDTNFKK